jgi:hypothetical protein
LAEHLALPLGHFDDGKMQPFMCCLPNHLMSTVLDAVCSPTRLTELWQRHDKRVDWSQIKQAINL